MMNATQLRNIRVAEDIKKWLLPRPRYGPGPVHHSFSSIISSYYQPGAGMCQTGTDTEPRYRTYTKQKKKKINSKEKL